MILWTAALALTVRSRHRPVAPVVRVPRHENFTLYLVLTTKKTKEDGVMERQVKLWKKNLLLGWYYSSSFLIFELAAAMVQQQLRQLQLHQKQEAARMSAAAPATIVRFPGHESYTLCLVLATKRNKRRRCTEAPGKTVEKLIGWYCSSSFWISSSYDCCSCTRSKRQLGCQQLHQIP